MTETKKKSPSLTCKQVIGEAQGSEEALQKFRKDIDSGPRHAHVVKVETSEIEAKSDESSFKA